MTIAEKVARAIYLADFAETMDGPPDDLETTSKTNQQNYADNATAAITAFLEAAAEQGWHMRRDITGTGYTDAFEWDK